MVLSDIRCLHAARAVLRVAGLLGVPTGVRDFASLDLETAPSSEHARMLLLHRKIFLPCSFFLSRAVGKTGLLLFDMCTLPLGQISRAFI